MTTDKTVLAQIERIRHLRSIGTSDTQIRDQLQLSEPAFWRRVRIMKRLDREVMMGKFTDDIASEIRMFEIRLMRHIMACESIINNRDAEDAYRHMRLKCLCSLIYLTDSRL
jgi:hypothetical protein